MRPAALYVLSGSILLLAVAIVVLGSPRPVSGGPGCGGGGDTDADGVCAFVDNCVLVPNGPAMGTDSCVAQEDGDMDGYGNPCDTDIDNDGGTTLIDVSETLSIAGSVGTDPRFDFDCDGGATLIDVSRVLSDAAAVVAPGPSGYACAGTIPCP